MNRAKENKIKSHTIEEWKELVERYFEATLSDKEEQELRLFLASEEASLPFFDEAKAVMGYFSTQKAQKQKKRKKAHRAIIGQITRYSAAAAIVGIIITGIWHYNQQEIYIAYVDGKKITDRETVMQQMHKAIAQVSNNTSEYSAHQQLSDIFSTLNESNKDIKIITK